MPVASLTRSITFAAAHRYRRPDWSDERNRETFGLCARESYHGHTFRCDVTLRGTIDEETGFIVDLGAFDRILANEITSRFDHRNINLDIPEFGEGRLIPTGENIARFIFYRIASAVPAGVSVSRVTVAEDATLSASYEGDV
jgi:6-pyruvoyltetrahydropterin/6-carboxytetrahydropterin synthase